MSKGKKLSEETKSKISETNKRIGKIPPSRKGIPHTEEAKRKIGNAHRNKIVSKETREKMSIARTGVKLSDSHRKAISKGHKGINTWSKGSVKSEETKKKMGKARRGEKHYRWIKDRTKLKRVNKQGERRTSIYVEWRKQVWLRDNFKCKINNKDCSGKIEAHHILSWLEFPELRYEINNGITLCHAHHPRKRAEEKKLQDLFKNLVQVS